MGKLREDAEKKRREWVVEQIAGKLGAIVGFKRDIKRLKKQIKELEEENDDV